MRVGEKYHTSSNRNDYNTPIEAWEVLIDNMEDTTVKFWLPFYNDGLIKKALKKQLKLNVIHVNKDFFSYEPKSYDIIADNPSYFQKALVFKRCLQLDKPFALLVPLETLERKYFAQMFKDDDRLQMIVPKKRYEFESMYFDSTGKVPFKSVWMCWKMNLKSKNNMIFE